MEGLRNELMNESMDSWMGEWMDVRKAGNSLNEWIKERIDE